MFCKQCGYNIGNANFCPECGLPASGSNNSYRQPRARRGTVERYEEGCFPELHQEPTAPAKKTFGQKLKNQFAEDVARQQVNPRKIIKRNNSRNICCPRCGSVNVQIMGGGRKKFSTGKAIVGSTLIPGGALIGFAGKKGAYDAFCPNCGRRWKVKAK